MNQDTILRHTIGLLGGFYGALIIMTAMALIVDGGYKAELWGSTSQFTTQLFNRLFKAGVLLGLASLMDKT